MVLGDMGFLQFVNDNFIGIIIFFAFFGGGIAAFFRYTVNKAAETKVKVEKSKERQLELQIQLEEKKTKNRSLPSAKKSNQAVKDEHFDPTYTSGYTGNQEMQMIYEEGN